MSGVMKTLADYYTYGIVVCCIIVTALYLAFSIRLIITARREGLDVCASALIPFFNIGLFFKKAYKKRKRVKLEKESKDIFEEDEEIEL